MKTSAIKDKGESFYVIARVEEVQPEGVLPSDNLLPSSSLLPSENVLLPGNTVYPTSSPEITVYKFSDNLSVTDITPNNAVSYIYDNYYKASIVAPNEDCYLLILFGNEPIVAVIGDPDIKFLFHGEISTTYTYARVSLGGTTIESGVLFELIDGFYYSLPVSDETSLYIIEDDSYYYDSFYMNLPYRKTVEVPVPGPPTNYSGGGGMYVPPPIVKYKDRPFPKIKINNLKDEDEYKKNNINITVIDIQEGD